jgi:hypothetical protein
VSRGHAQVLLQRSDATRVCNGTSSETNVEMPTRLGSVRAKLLRISCTKQLSDGTSPAGGVEVEDEQHRPLFLLPLRSVAS